MESDSPTEEALYGDLDVTREGGPDGPFRIVFRPFGHNTAAGAGRLVETAAALNAALRDLGLTDDQVHTLCSGLENSTGSWLRLLAATAVLKRHGLV